MAPFACPCCGFLTMSGEPPGTYDLCPVCRWEDDEVQFRNPDLRGGANSPSLAEARASFQATGTSDPLFRDEVRPPTLKERSAAEQSKTWGVVRDLAVRDRGGRSMRDLAEDPDRIIDLPERNHFVGWGSAALGQWELWIPIGARGPVQAVVVATGGARAVVGYDDYLIGLDLRGGSIIHLVHPPALSFFEMHVLSDDLVVAVFDLAVVEYSIADGCRWTYTASDMVTGWRWESGGVWVDTDDGAEVLVDFAEQRRVAAVMSDGLDVGEMP